MILLRHDIDRTPQRALDIAQVEHEYGIRATYYFRALKGIYLPEVMDRIALLGHEIGYHYETLDKCRGDRARAQELFQKELADFRRRYIIRTVCAHGNPLTRFDNKDIWKNLSLTGLGLDGEAFLSLDFNRLAYFSDSGRTWKNTKSQKMPGKESVRTAFDRIQARNTDDIIAIIKAGSLPGICILTHPERWNKTVLGFASRYLLDTAFSWGKVMIYLVRR